VSDLTLPLALLGIVAVLAVLVHGRWQASRLKPRLPAEVMQPRPTHSRPGEFDALAPGRAPLETLRVPAAGDPVLDARPGDPGDAGPVDRATDRAADGTADWATGALDGLPGRLEPRFEAGPARDAAALDAAIDAIATLSVDVRVSGEAALAHLPPTRRAGSKPFRIEGLNAETGEFETLRPSQRYSEFQAGVQIANRLGAINEIEYSEFVQKVQDFCDAIGAMPAFPDMLGVVERARALDAFANDHDAQLAAHLRARSASWSVAYIQQHAARHGFVPGLVPGRLVLPAADPGGPPVLVLSFDPQAALADSPQQAVVRDVVLSFDVPQTPREVEPFLAWQASAQALSLGMDAEVVDDRGQPISAAGFATIGDDLTQLYDALAGRELAAGSAAARRLFS
jgi:hypothetical protein